MSSQQFPRLGTPTPGLSQAPAQIASSGSAGLINPAAAGETRDTLCCFRFKNIASFLIKN